MHTCSQSWTLETAACAPQSFIDSLSGRLTAEDSHMETITQLQETDLLSAPCLVWRRERMEGEVNHMFWCKQRNCVARGLWSTHLFLEASWCLRMRRCAASVSGSSDPAEVNSSLCVVSFQHLTSGSDETLLTHKYKLKIPHMLLLSTTLGPLTEEIWLHIQIKINRFVISIKVCFPDSYHIDILHYSNLLTVTVWGN